MSDKMRHYNVEEFNKQKRQQGRDLRVPPRANLLAAANHMRDFFENKKYPYGFMGGLEMLCLGYRREMPDLQIAYEDKDFIRIKAKLETDQRVRLPDGMNQLFPAKILVRTGPAYHDKGCTEAAIIEVDLIPPGTHGTPSTGMLSRNLVLLSMKPDGKLKTYKGLNMLYLVKTLVHYCRVRDIAWDARKDLLFLCRHHAEEIQSIRVQIDQKAIQQNFLATTSFSRLSLEDQRRCYQVLLGKEPPPAMALTPPPQDGHKYSRSASEVPRSRITSHKSSPSLHQQSSSALLSPPLPGTPGSSPKATLSNASLPVELSASLKPVSELRGANAGSSEISIPKKDSRSRYRPISAPGSRNVSPEGQRPSNHPQYMSMDIRHQPQMLEGAFYTHHTGGGQNLPYASQEAMTGLPPTMTNVNVGFQAQMMPNSFSQPTFMNGGFPFQALPQHIQALPVEMSATPAPYNPGQEHLKSQLGLGGDSLFPQYRTKNQARITNKPIPPNARTAYEGAHRARAEQSKAPGIQSQQGSLHLVSPEGERDRFLQQTPNLNEVTSKLHLVGPEGVYGAPDKLHQPVQKKVTKENKNIPVAFELESNSIVAELSANIDAALGTSEVFHPTPQELFSEPIQPLYINKSKLEDSPVSPPDAQIAPTATQLASQEPNRPSNTRTQSAPFPVLPSSLMAGGLRPHHRSPSTTMPSSAPDTASGDQLITQTNASRYTSYHSPPSSAPHSVQVSPQLAPAATSQYKAYRPPSTPLSPPTDEQPTIALDKDSSHLSGFRALKDVDGKHHYFRTHKRNASYDSQASNASHDSSKLAADYQAELPDFENGYGSVTQEVHH